jgi:hypothetical protein
MGKINHIREDLTMTKDLNDSTKEFIQKASKRIFKLIENQGSTN